MITSTPSRLHRRVVTAPRHRPVALAIAGVLAMLSIGDGHADHPHRRSHRDGSRAATIEPVAYNDLKGSTRDVSIEFHEGTNMAATPSPDGRRIAFTAQGALWIVSVNGGQAQRLTPVTVEPTAPAWSPDGSVIAFQNYTPDGNWHIFTIRPDGSRLTEVTTGYFDDREPSWMPDGSAIVFASDRSGDGQYKIWQHRFDTGETVAITTGPGAESQPVVSPDGRQLAFVDTNRIFTLALDRADPPVQVAEGTAPAWSADGSGLVHQTPAGAWKQGGQELSTDEDLFPFPPQRMSDGRWLYTADGHLRVRSADGRSRTDVPFSATLELRRPVFTHHKDRHFDDLRSRPVQGISAPALSPDGTRIAFVALNDVWVMPVGGAPVRLTDDLDRDGNVQWTPDGKAVYFSSEKGNGGALAIDRIDVDTRARTRLASIPGKSMVMPRLSPTGDRIAYTTLSGQLEIWNVGSGTADVVMPQVGTQVSTPQWTPDGSKIVLVDNERINNRFREGYNKLRVIDLATRTAKFHAVADAPRQVSDREEGAAVLSPDGTRLAVIIDSVLHVMPMNADGMPAGAAVPITTEAADLPSWAGDSRTILYKSSRRLRMIQADGSGARDVEPPAIEWTQQTGPALTIIHAGALWDGIHPGLQTNVDIILKGNRIEQVRPHVDEPVPTVQAGSMPDASGVLRIDASNETVMPGLWDPHVHPLTLYQGGQFGQVAALMLSYGITSTQSVAGPIHQSIELRESIDAGRLNGPRLFVSPPLWEGNRQFYSFARTLRTPAVADLEIAKAVEMDVDFMKSYVRAPFPIMQRIAQAGLDVGIPTGTHMLSPGAASGLAGTTHLSATQRMGYGWSKSVRGITYQDAYDLHAKADFHNIDTLFSSLPLTGADPAFIADDRFRLLVPPNFVAGLKDAPSPSNAALELMRRDAEQSAKVQRAGALVALGTDTPLVAPGIGLHTNLRAGGMVYSNFQALQNVTINAARMAFVDRDLGSVEAGKLADLIIVGGDPLSDLRNAANVHAVVRNGVHQTVDQILAPFRTPAAVAARRAAVVAWQQRCAADERECGETGGHAD